MKKLSETDLCTKYGVFRETYFSKDKEFAIVLTKGNVEKSKEVPLRIHSSCLSSHTFNSVECDCQLQMDTAQDLINNEGLGLIIWLNHEGRGNGHLAKMMSNKYKKLGYSQNEAFSLIGYKGDIRDYSFAVCILKYYEIQSVKIITNNYRKINAVLNSGIEISHYIEAPILNESRIIDKGLP